MSDAVVETKRKPNVPVDKFIATYKAAKSNREVAEALGMTVNNVMTRAANINEKLVKAGKKGLPKFERAAGGNRLDVAELDALVNG